MTSSSRVALCLNSSFLGFYAHGGFVQALTELGVRPAAISGASAGALVAGLFAAGVSPARMQELFNSPKLPHAFREPGAPLRGLATLANLRGQTGAIRGDRALALLREHLGERRIEDCRDPRLALSITNLSQARSEIATRGPLAEMILASGAFPGVFAARPVDGDFHWDGGVANPLPFDHWLADPAIDTIIIHIVANPEELAVRRQPGPLRMSGAINLSHQIVCDELFRLKTELARHARKRLIVLRTLAPRPRLWNPAKVGACCLEIGRATVADNRAALEELAA